jgi:hypothetical protein
MKILTFAAVLGLLAVPAVAAADAVPKQVLDLECLVGNWKGTGTFAMGKDKAKIEITWNCARTSAQFGVLCTGRFTGIPGMAAYEETDLFGYEPNTDTYHWYAVTNAGETHDHVAKPPTSNKIQFVFTGTQEGKPMKEVIDMEFGKDKKSLSVHSETFVGGTSTAVLDAKATK